MILPWLRLFRIAGLTTIVSNVIAVVATTGLGSIDIFREVGQHLPHGLWVLCASVFTYLAGMIWNDIADVERDAIIAPKRPLPSGRVTYINAWIIGVLCMILALMCAAQVGWRGFYTAAVVLCCALAYNFGAKHIPWLGSSASSNIARPNAGSCYWAVASFS
jgi:4-hydroxybenzoate polyprenyltransferase